MSYLTRRGKKGCNYLVRTSEGKYELHSKKGQKRALIFDKIEPGASWFSLSARKGSRLVRGSFSLVAWPSHERRPTMPDPTLDRFEQPYRVAEELIAKVWRQTSNLASCVLSLDEPTVDRQCPFPSGCQSSCTLASSSTLAFTGRGCNEVDRSPAVRIQECALSRHRSPGQVQRLVRSLIFRSDSRVGFFAPQAFSASSSGWLFHS